MRTSGLGLLAIALAVTLSAEPQQPPTTQDPQRPPTFRTEANFVRVDVYPTLNGKPVRDLAQTDFEILEDGVPQKVSTFEYVEIRTGDAQDRRQEPNTIQQSRDAMKNPRARVFVLFLDVPHVTIGGTWHAREPLVKMIDRVLGPDDLVGIMTPRMAATDVVFARKTEMVESGLRDKWPWGERHTLQQDEMENLFEACFPWRETKEVVAEMKLRRRERLTLDALQELVTWLRDQREERKGILTISEGWLLYRPNSDLTRPRQMGKDMDDMEPIPGAQPIGVGPDGRLRAGERDTFNAPGTRNDCWANRQWLSQIDNERYFRDIIDSANRANATFYTVDPRGLPVFDYPMGPDQPPSILVDRAHLQQRTDALRVLADNTDGIAVMGNNDLDPGLRRIADDLTSYYLLGYYSSNTKLDGRFRKVTVKIKRPGVDVRARRGYKAATEAEVTAARTATAASPVSAAVAAARTALSTLARLRPEAKLYAQAIAIRDPSTGSGQATSTGSGQAGVTVWFTGELAKPVSTATSAAISVTAGAANASVDVPLSAGQRAFTGSLVLKEASGPIDVRVRVAPAGEIPFTDAVRIDAVTGLSLPLMFRRGQSTGNRYQPAGKQQFSRTERIRFDVQATGGATLTDVRILDRNGNRVDVPVTQSQREGWLSAEVTLAALGPGDYLVELSGMAAGAEQKVLAAFRVVR